MTDKFFQLKNIHISEKNPTQIIFWGDNPVKGKTDMRVWIDRREVPVTFLSKDDLIYKHLLESSDEKINTVGTIDVPADVMRKKSFDLIGEVNGKKTIRGHFEINRDTSGFVYNLEKVIYRDNGSVDIEGWAVDKTPVEVRLTTGSGKEIPVEKKYRKDMYSAWPELDEEDLNAGFKVTIPKEDSEDYPWKLTFKYSHGTFERQFTKRTSVKESWKADGGVKRAGGGNREHRQFSGAYTCCAYGSRQFLYTELSAVADGVVYKNWRGYSRLDGGISRNCGIYRCFGGIHCVAKVVRHAVPYAIRAKNTLKTAVRHTRVYQNEQQA